MNETSQIHVYEMDEWNMPWQITLTQRCKVDQISSLESSEIWFGDL